MKTLPILLLFLAAAVFVQSCGTTTISAPVTKPADVDIAKYKTVCVGEFGVKLIGGNVDEHFLNYLKQVCKIDAIDRGQLDSLLKINGLQISDLARPEKSAIVKERLGEVAMISSQVLARSFELIERDRYFDWYNLGVGFVLKVNFKIADLTSGKFIFTQDFSTYTLMLELERRDQTADSIAEEGLGSACRNIFETFVKCLYPMNLNKDIKFLTDSDLPTLEEGVALIEKGSWEEGINKFLASAEAAKGDELLAKAYYDLALAYQYTYTFEKAHEAFAKACSLSNDKMYADAASNCKKMEEERYKTEAEMQFIKE